jgi:hypothetical protein
MYKSRDGQVNFDEFNQPIGMELDLDNRWIKKAKLIPWDEVEKEYASLFPAREGNVAKPARMALGALIIQKEYGFSDGETVSMIQENPYFQYFCGMKKYTQEVPFDPSLMVHFRKRFTSDVLSGINEKLIASAKKREQAKSDKKSKDNEPAAPDKTAESRTTGDAPTAASSETTTPVKGTLMVDATCAPSYIKYPTDTGLLNKAREQSEKIIRILSASGSGKCPRTYARTARKEFVNFSRKRNKTKKEIRRMVFKQLGYLKRDLRIIDAKLGEGSQLPVKWASRLEVIRSLYEQQKYMYENKTHSVSSRIVSLSQPWIRPIVRGKTKTPVEFGAKLDISVVDGFARLEETSFEAYNESSLLQGEIERFRERTGYYPERVLADKIYRNRENLKYCASHGIRLSGPALGRRPKDFVPDRKGEYRDMCERIEVERAFSLAKRKYGLGTIYTRLPETTLCAIALSIMLLNLNKVLFCAFILAQLYVKMMEVKFTRPRLGRAVQ